MLGSLPAPEETAQALVIKGAESEGGATHKRRESISHFFRRKFSRKKDCELPVNLESRRHPLMTTPHMVPVNYMGGGGCR